MLFSEFEIYGQIMAEGKVAKYRDIVFFAYAYNFKACRELSPPIVFWAEKDDYGETWSVVPIGVFTSFPPISGRHLVRAEDINLENKIPDEVYKAVYKYFLSFLHSTS